MTSYHEGDTLFRIARLLADRAWRIVSETSVRGKVMPIVHRVDIPESSGLSMEQAFHKGIEILQMKIRADLPGETALKSAMDRAREKETAQKVWEQRALDEFTAEREAASRLLNQSNPLWGAF